MHNNHNLDLVNIDAYAKFGQIPFIRSQDIERKQSRNHRIMASRHHGQPENRIPKIGTTALEGSVA